MLCNNCDGKGHVGIVTVIKKQYNIDIYNTCRKCFGTGEVDWIEQIVGKKGTRFVGELCMYKQDYENIENLPTNIDWETSNKKFRVFRTTMNKLPHIQIYIQNCQCVDAWYLTLI